MRIHVALSLAALALGLSASACGSSGGGGDIPEAARTEANQIFTTRCTPCHGTMGEGNGPASAGLDPKPRNFREASWQSSITDERMAQVITGGGAAVGKSAAMPGNPDLTGKPDVVRALVAHIRSLKQ